MKLLAMRLCSHDANLSLYDDGKVTYVKTERINQEKHHFYSNLWEWKFDIAELLGVELDEIDEIAIVVDEHKHNLVNQRINVIAQPFDGLKVDCPVYKIEHHYAHAQSAWMLGDTEYQFVFDGFGEEYDVQPDMHHEGNIWTVFKDYEIINRKNVKSIIKTDMGGIDEYYPSLGVLHDCIAERCGITGHGDDRSGKLMSLQSYGNFDQGYYESHIKGKTIEDLGNIYEPDCWGAYKGNKLIASHKLLDWARTVNESIPEILIEFFERHGATKDSRILFTGGCAQNILWNTELKKHFPNLVVAPHSADEGLSLGALKFLMDKHNVTGSFEQKFPYAQNDQAPEELPSPQTIKAVAQLLADGKIVGWYQGNGEIGPRALGNRSILMRPDLPDGKEKINVKVKNRETYRPFGASVLKEHASTWFYFPHENPYMMYVSDVFNADRFPAICHVDKTCRHQTVAREQNQPYYDLINEFYKLTDIPFVLNTSLNRGGKPIAGSIKDAVGLLEETALDYLVVGDTIMQKRRRK
jgi:carbamoyltransferase